MRRGWILLPALWVIGLLVPAPATALPDCKANQRKPEQVIAGRGLIESVVVDAKGRMFFTDAGVQGLVRLDGPEAKPVVLAEGKLVGGGGIVIDDDGTLLVGYGDQVPVALMGKTNPSAGIVRIDPETGVVTPYAQGTQMSNGMARMPVDGAAVPKGTIFASNDILGGIDRVAPGGTPIEIDWANVSSANGLAIDSTHRYLFANQTFQPSSIARVDIADPSKVETYAKGGTEDEPAGLDGMTIDERDRLFVAVNGTGQAWRVDPDRKICRLGTGLGQASATALGQGDKGFKAGDLYVVNFGGVVWKIPAVTEPKVTPAPIDDVAPRVTRLRIEGHRVRFSIDEAAKTTVSIARRTCTKATTCRYVTARSVTFDAGAGDKSLLLNRGRRAKPGRWRATVQATDLVGNAAGAVTRSGLVRARKR